jgi:AcrR family transcriptional regulator
MTENESRRSARRQQRGLQRQAAILEAAGLVFAAVGYSDATTNAIADRAGISPGSLYQFFPNKEAIADALAKQYTRELHHLWDSTFSLEITHVPLNTLIDILIDSIISFDQERPGFSVIFFGDDTSTVLAAMGNELHDGIIARFVSLISARNPRLPPEQSELIANVMMRLYKAFVPPIVGLHAQQNPQMIGEMKAVLRGYLTPYIGG